MAKPSRSPKLLALKRRQLDAKLTRLQFPSAPAAGWIRTIRAALGMSSGQLGKRLNMTPQGALDLERRERDGSITLGKLREAAAALDCELRIVFQPTSSLNDTVTRQADAKARAERNRIVHTMRLEAQDDGVDAALGASDTRDAWLTTRIATLWD